MAEFDSAKKKVEIPEFEYTNVMTGDVAKRLQLYYQLASSIRNEYVNE